MKKYLKELLPVIVISSVMGFMFFIYEQITLFANSTENFAFGLGVLLKTNILYLLAFVFSIICFSIFILFISKKTKKELIYRIYVLILSIIFITMYIQGNYLSQALPVLDGSSIDWSSFLIQNIISIALLLIVLGISIFLFIKYKDKYFKISTYISLAIFIMLFVSLLTTMTTKQNIYEEKGLYTVTIKDFNKLSSNKNYLILLVDMLDSKTFDKVLKDSNKEYILKDFSYYPDTLSTYGFTRESVPYILSGKYYEALEEYTDYYTKAMNESLLFKLLKDNNYEINLYENELIWNDEKITEVNNVESFSYDLAKICFLEEETKYIMFKYLPFPLKQYSNIESLNYNRCRKSKSKYIYTVENDYIYDNLDKIELQEDNYFQFVHIEGGHYPFNLDKDLNSIDDGTYEQKIESAITVIEKYLDRVKESGMYDNSVIIIMSDHGYNGSNHDGRQNPSLYIKGFNETHDNMIVSNKKVSYQDLYDSIYSDLLNGSKSNELLKNVSNNRVRRYIYYKEENHMYEQTLDGHAWETDKLKDTGKTYFR